MNNVMSDEYVSEDGRRFTGPRALYHYMHRNAPVVPPYDEKSIMWLSTALARFGDELTIEASKLAKESGHHSMLQRKALEELLYDIWGLVSRALDINSYNEKDLNTLEHIETNLGFSVYRMRFPNGPNDDD